MPKAADLKKGMIVDINGTTYVVKDIDVKSPSSRSGTTLYKVRFNNVQTKQKLDESFKGEDMLKEVDFSRRQAQYLYKDGDMYTFMDIEDYSQYSLNSDDLEDQVDYLVDGLEGVYILMVGERVLGIELPQSVNLAITDTAPAIKGASATSRTKTAALSTGLEIQVPEYIETGEVVRVNTETGKFMSRA